jgi:hypothetical protein
MTIGDEEVGPAVGRMLGRVFDAMQDWSRRDRASALAHRLEDPPAALPSVSNIVVRNDSDETIVWFQLCERKYTFKREYLIDGVSLTSLPDSLASVRDLIASPSDHAFALRLCLLDHSERVLFVGTDPRKHESFGTSPGEVEAFTPGRWVEDFLRLSEALGGRRLW